MRRRQLLVALGGAAAWPHIAKAQQVGKIPRIGVLADPAWPFVEGLRRGLRDLGYIEGQNIVLEFRWVSNTHTDYGALAKDIVQLLPNVVVTYGSPATLAAQRTMTTIPIVIAAIGDDGLARFVPNLSRPGGNITGFSTLNDTMAVKRLKLLSELLPKLSRVAYLRQAANPTSMAFFAEMSRYAAALGFELMPVDVGDGGLKAALETVVRMRPDAVTPTGDLFFLNERERITGFLKEHRLPAIYPNREYAVVGGLLSYGTDYYELFRRAAAYVDRILKGASPSTLPAQQAEKFELVINLNAAKAD